MQLPSALYRSAGLRRTVISAGWAGKAVAQQALVGRYIQADPIGLPGRRSGTHTTSNYTTARAADRSQHR
ncbi:MAG: hypothetical protein M3Q19_05025 [Pseudomonadota bacterium]|nr:hypothetical protein [Pseudomonadota bacterium]